jgi:hypothetical protein
MPEKKRLSAVLDERIVPYGRKTLKSFETAEALAAADPVVLAAVLEDGASRHMKPEQALAMAKGYVETQLPPATDDETQPAAQPE